MNPLSYGGAQTYYYYRSYFRKKDQYEAAIKTVQHYDQFKVTRGFESQRLLPTKVKNYLYFGPIVPSHSSTVNLNQEFWSE